MKRCIKTLEINYEMYYELMYTQRNEDKECWYKTFIPVETYEDWLKLVEGDDSNWKHLHVYFYIKGDIKYFFSETWVFWGMEKLPNYFDELHNTYWYIWMYRASNKFTPENKTSKPIDGNKAWREFMKELKRHYTGTEINKVINECGTADEDVGDILHYSPYGTKDIAEDFCEFKAKDNCITTIDNCCYYDINKAYASNLMHFFPKLEDWMMKGYKEDKQRFKKVINYAVGMMQRHGDECGHFFRRLRNTIVTNTTNTLNETMNYIIENSKAAMQVYVNTDGFIMKDADVEINYSDKIGDFGKETIDNNRVWSLRVNIPGWQKYAILQWFENGKKVIKSLGGFRLDEQLVSKVDLSQGKIVLFTQEKLYDGEKNKDMFVLKDIKEADIHEIQ